MKKDTTGGQKLTGMASGEEWSAKAVVTASVIDLKGEILVECPANWVQIHQTWENPENIDYLFDWVLYADGEKVDDWVVEGIRPSGENQLVFQVLCKVDDASAELKLAPVFSRSGEHLEQAILIKAE